MVPAPELYQSLPEVPQQASFPPFLEAGRCIRLNLNAILALDEPGRTTFVEPQDPVAHDLKRHAAADPAA